MKVGDFCEIVEEGRRRHRGSVISWGRDAARNRRVGGHPRSRHLDGLACDIVFDDVRHTRDCFYWYKAKGLAGYIKPGSRSLHIQVPLRRRTARA